MIGLRELASNLARMQGWTNGWRNQSPRAPMGHRKSLAVFFQIEHPRANCRLALRINKAMCGPRIWDSTHPFYFLSITSFAVFPAVR
jgi:hypothetical protein